MWLSVHFEISPSGKYRRVERGALDRNYCDSPWLEVEYEGTWAHAGPSNYTNGSSLATIRILAVWMKLLKDTVCLPKVDEHDPLELPKCFDTHAALKAMCPCNGWDWVGKGVPRERNIGMFCGPSEQCPLLHEVYLQQNHYISYNATDHSACLAKANVDPARGWKNPVDDACIAKELRANCIAGVLDHGARVHLTWLPCLLTAAAVLLGCSAASRR